MVTILNLEKLLLLLSGHSLSDCLLHFSRLMKDVMCVFVCVRDMCEHCFLIMHSWHSVFHEIIVQPNSWHSSVNTHLSYSCSDHYGIGTRSSLRLRNYSSTNTHVGMLLNTASHTSIQVDTITHMRA